MSTVKENKEKGMLSQILRKFFKREGGRKNILEVMQDNGVDTREGTDSGSGVRISWKRGIDSLSFFKTDKKGRLFVGQKFSSVTTWGLNYKLNKGKWSIINKITTTPAVIQVNIRPANGKRGGWLINVHNQTAFFKDDRFVFRCRWANYWASDAMIVAGLVSKCQNGKLGKSAPLSEVLGDYERVAMVIENIQDYLICCNMDKLPSHEERMAAKRYEELEKSIFHRQWRKSFPITY